MKFDVIIGNPPYQEEAKGNNKFAPPIYHRFMEESYTISEKTLFITPGRFLFNAGSTPKSFNENMLSDTHLKVINFEANSDVIFPNTDIKGGIAVTYRDQKKQYSPIGTFTSYNELNSILQKVKTDKTKYISDDVSPQDKYDLEILYNDYPQYKNIIGSEGKDRRLRTNAFEKLNVFKEKPKDRDDLKVLGLIKNIRVYRYISDKYIIDSGNLYKFKVFVPKSNGSGALGEVLSTPIIGTPMMAHTQSFISIGAFDTEYEAQSALKYVKSKFARTMLGTLKITQDNPRSTWKNVPLQDFTENSDIDWSKSIPEIDQQLYKKYELSDEEINFIETNVQIME